MDHEIRLLGCRDPLLSVLPLAVSPRLSRHERNRLALRETAGTLLNHFLDRM